MQEAKKSGSDIIKNLGRKDFHKKFVQGICQTTEFSTLASFWAENTPKEDKDYVRNQLKNFGIPLELTASDDDLNDIITAITSRAVAIR